MNIAPVYINITDYLFDYADNKFGITERAIDFHSDFFRIVEQNLIKKEPINEIQLIQISSLAVEKNCSYMLSGVGNSMLSGMIHSLLYADMTEFLVKHQNQGLKKQKTIELFMQQHNIGHEGRENMIRQYYRNVRDRVYKSFEFKTYCL